MTRTRTLASGPLLVLALKLTRWRDKTLRRSLPDR